MSLPYNDSLIREWEASDAPLLLDHSDFRIEALGNASDMEAFQSPAHVDIFDGFNHPLLNDEGSAIRYHDGDPLAVVLFDQVSQAIGVVSGEGGYEAIAARERFADDVLGHLSCCGWLFDYRFLVRTCPHPGSKSSEILKFGVSGGNRMWCRR